MNYPLSYRVPLLYAKYSQIRNLTFWAGGLGVAVIMMGLTIVGILAYNGIVPAPANTTFGNLIPYTLYILYFMGDNKPDNFAAYDYNVLLDKTVQNPLQLLIWQCVYLAVATIWLLSSVLLLTHVKKQDPKLTLANLSGWVFFTICICALDLSLGIIFGIDYGNFHEAALAENFAQMNGSVDPNNMQLVAASVAALAMSIVALKGYVFWIINAGLAIYFMVTLGRIAASKDSNDTLFIPRQEDNDDIMTTQPPAPINAYEEKSQSPAISMGGYANVAYVDVPEQRNNNTSSVELNQASIARAARISTDVNLNERHFRNLETYQQYPPPPQYNNNSNISQNSRPESMLYGTANNNNNNMNSNNANMPMPDYSPPMTRSNQRYQ